MGPVDVNELSRNARGGTELMAERLVASLPAELLAKFQIIPTRVRQLDPARIRILWCHETPVGPEAQQAVAHGGWRRYHRIVFVSHSQMQSFCAAFDIPWSRCAVIRNGITPVPGHDKPEGPLTLGYWSVPDRGLALLAPVFADLAKTHDIRLEVFSSFNLYGWPQHDRPFASLFDFCRNHPRITYHGAVEQPVMREALQRMHILAYPSILPETSCLVLMEAMSAGMACVHPNLGSLYETAAGHTEMYQFQETASGHAEALRRQLERVIHDWHSGALAEKLALQKAYADRQFDWQARVPEWRALLESLQHLPKIP